MAKILIAAFALAALACGLVAAWFSRRAANVQVVPGWTGPGQFEPVIPELAQMGWITGTLRAMQVSSSYSHKAVNWTIAAVVSGALASFIGLIA